MGPRDGFETDPPPANMEVDRPLSFWKPFCTSMLVGGRVSLVSNIPTCFFCAAMAPLAPARNQHTIDATPHDCPYA